MACVIGVFLRAVVVFALYLRTATSVRYDFRGYSGPAPAPVHHRLLLTSNGLSTVPIQQQFTKLLYSKNSRYPAVLYIPDAALAEGDKEEALCHKRQHELTGLGAATVDCMVLKGKVKQELQTTLWKYDALYVEYGNTFYLRYYMHKSGFDDLISPIINSGVLYIGSSASTICAGVTISIAFWKGWDDPGQGMEWDLSDTEEKYTGLGLVPDLSFFPHFAPKYKTMVEAKMKELDHPLIILSDAEAYVIDGSERKRINPPPHPLPVLEDDL